MAGPAVGRAFAAGAAVAAIACAEPADVAAPPPAWAIDGAASADVKAGVGGGGDNAKAAPRRPIEVAIPDPVTCPVGAPPADPIGPVPALAGCIATVPDDVPIALGSDDPAAALAHRADGAPGIAPYQEGQWARLVEGIQGTGHLDTDVLFDHPSSAAKLAVETLTQMWFDCQHHTETAPWTVPFVPAGPPGRWMPQKPIKSIVHRPLDLACGHWMRVQLLFRVVGESQWRRAGCTQRPYLAAPPKPSMPP